MYNCELCEFTSNTEDGIKIHKSAKHETISSTMEVNVDQENDQTVYNTNDFNNLIRPWAQ